VKKIFAVFLILLAVFASYAPSLQNGFVWDDTALILRDPLIRSWRLTPEGFNHFLFVDATASDFYRPIQRLTYTLDYAVAAFRPGPYHLTSLLCHAAAAIALFFFAEELLRLMAFETRKRWLISLLVALTWAIHPVNSSAVIYISGRADPLAAMFGFLGLYLVLRGGRATGSNKSLLLAAALVPFLLSALSKEIGLIFPVLALAILALRRNWTDVWKTAAIAAVVFVTYASLRLGAEHFPPPVLRPPAPLSARPILVARAAAEYAGLILLPINLHMDRDVEANSGVNDDAKMRAASWRELQTLLGMVLIAGLIYWMIRAYKRDFAVFTCLALFVASYLPVSGIISLNATVAEHWLYLPSAFLFLAGAIAIVDLVGKLKERRSPDRHLTESAAEKPPLLESSKLRSLVGSALLALLVIWFVFLGARTFIRTFDWKDQRTFLERTLAHGGDSARMLINLASLDFNEGKLEDAALHLHAALEKEPNQPFAVINLAAIALKQDDFKLAHTLLDRATKMPAVEPQAHELLAVLENKETGRANLQELRLATRKGTPSWAIEKRYIKLLDEIGDTTAAMRELNNCLRREWYRAESWQLLGQLLQKAGRQAQAEVALANARSYDVHLDQNPAP
jgi:Flp pilus assembly protein TadD